MDSTKLNTTECSLYILHILNRTTIEKEQDVLDMSACFYWHITSGKRHILPIFVVLFLFSLVMNSFLLTGLMTLKDRFWQPFYTLLKNRLICGLLHSFVAAFTVLQSLLLQRTVMFGGWCIAQFSVLGTILWSSQITLALMAMERYVFICHSIHYLGTVTPRRTRLALGLVWVLSAIVGNNHLILLNLPHHGFTRVTAGLLCEPRIVKASVSFSHVQELLFLGPPSIIATVSIFILCFCYWYMYKEAHRAVVALQLHHQRAYRTVAFYLCMFLLQMVPMFYCLSCLQLEEQTLLFQLSQEGIKQHITLLVFLMVPPCINPVVYVICNNELKKGLLHLYQRRHVKRECVGGD